MSFSDNLKRLRIEKGISQQALAKAAGVSQTAVYHWEKGVRTPKVGAVARMATILDVPVEEFFTEYENGEPVIDLDASGMSSEEMHEYINYILPEYINSLGETKSDKINELFDSLNDLGQDKAIEQVELLTKIPEYKANVTTSVEANMKLDKDGNLTECPDNIE